MNSPPDLEPAVRAGASHQIGLHRLTGGIGSALGLLFSAAIFVEGKEDEGVVRVVCAILGLSLLAGSVTYVLVTTARVKRLVELLLRHREQLRAPVLIVHRRAGNVVGYGVSVRDKANRHYKMFVHREQDARAMLANLPQ